MASRFLLTRRLREGEKLKNVDGETRNRRALIDIGNLVGLKPPKVKPQIHICRPISSHTYRSLSGQLITRSQPGTLIGHNKKSEARVPVTKAIKKEAEKRREVIGISHDTKEKKVDRDAACLGSARRNKVPTTTKILAARSRAACGVIADLDVADVDNELAVVEYADEIYKFYKHTENETRPRHDYMSSQPDLNEKMRAILVDWLIEVHYKFKLMPETLYLAINLVDRFLSRKTVPRRELQLVGIGAMLIACKYEEIWAPKVNDFVGISDKVYTHVQLLRIEKAILCVLEWKISVPTHYMFLDRFIKASVPDKKLENMVYFLTDLALMSYAALAYSPSLVVASAVYIARRTLHESPAWTETLELHTQFAETQLIDCAKLLLKLHSEAAESKLRVVFNKYSTPENCAVSSLSLPPESVSFPPY